MVPILIVLCPSFSGENGAYQATAIALASDILGSAVTTITYGQHNGNEFLLSSLSVMDDSLSLFAYPCYTGISGTLHYASNKNIRP